MPIIIDGRIIEKHSERTGPVSVQNVVDRLQYHAFFKLFPQEVRDALFKKAIHKSFKAGEHIYCRGDTEAFMGVIVSGRVRMSMNAADGRGLLLGMVEPGEVFGETTLIDGMPRTTDALAESDSSVMLLRRDDFIPVLKSNPEALFGVSLMLCHRLRIYIDTIDLIALQNLPIRLARLILRLAGEYGTEENGQLVIRAGLNQASLGQKLATSRESINKQLKAFVTAGYITLNGDEITIIDAAGLNRITG